ncbi:hypothetical protein IMZ48_17365 [Candidatus Bathyarchaeota archaeon]|nr:hypothetical protein [Candidatus Bathyarchaeota archaeon]
MRLAAGLWLGLFSAVTSTCDRKTCVVKGSGTNKTDDAPAVRQAFESCGHGGQVIFEESTFYINSVLNITGLKDVNVDVHGTLLVS